VVARRVVGSLLLCVNGACDCGGRYSKVLRSRKRARFQPLSLEGEEKPSGAA
jgi:hypothetical protein